VLLRLDIPMRDTEMMLRSLRCPVKRHGKIGRYIYLRGTYTGFEDGCPPSILPHVGLGSCNTFDSAALNAFNGTAQDILHRSDVPHAQRDREGVSWTWWTKSNLHGVPAGIAAVFNDGGALHRAPGKGKQDSRAPS